MSVATSPPAIGASVASPIAPRARPRLHALPVDPLTTEETLAWIQDRVEASAPMSLVTTLNLNFLTHARANPEFRQVLQEAAALNVIDGWPVAWLLRRQHGAATPRAPGSELTPLLLRSPAMRPHGIYLLGDAPETLAAVRTRAALEGWEATIRGARSPSRAEVDDDAASARLVNEINASGARVLLVGFGPPRQELWLARWRHLLAPAVGIGIGGSFKFVAWPKRRAPRWVQRLNLEWLHRILLEPRRLGPRYASDALELARLVRVGGQSLGVRPAPRAVGQGSAPGCRGMTGIQVAHPLRADEHEK